MTTTFKVQFEVNLPTETTLANAEEWVRFQLGANGDMKLSNPLSERDLEACGVIVDQD